MVYLRDERGMADSSRKNHLAVLRSFSQTLSRRLEVPDPTRTLDEVRFHAPVTKRIYLTKREAEILLSSMDKQVTNVSNTSEENLGNPEREQTKTDHLRRIYAHLGYRRPTSADLHELFGWLVERALEHDDSALLTRLAAEKLRADRIVRPGVSRLERVVAAARGRTDEETHRTLRPVLTDATRARLDALLRVDTSLSPARTRHAWLKEGATSNTPKAIVAHRIHRSRRSASDKGWEAAQVSGKVDRCRTGHGD